MLLNEIVKRGWGPVLKPYTGTDLKLLKIIYFDYNIMFTIVLFIFLVKHVLTFTYTLTDFYCQFMYRIRVRIPKTSSNFVIYIQLYVGTLYVIEVSFMFC